MYKEKIMTNQISQLIQSFESDTRNPKDKFNQFLIYVFFTFDKRIRNIKTDKSKDKYKKMKNNVLQYIATHKREIIAQLR
jgi:hypothetical protein